MERREAGLTIDAMIRAVQEHYKIDVDGRAGPQTWTAIYNDVVVFGEIKDSEISPVDARSEKHISTLLPVIRPLARALVHECAKNGFTIKVIDGSRTYEQQAELRRKYEQGGPKAARPGWSNHNFGLAFDIGVFKGSAYVPEGPQYAQAGATGKSLGLSWGGDWRGGDEDPPHFQFRPAWARGMTETQLLTELRARTARGQDLLA